MEHVDVLVVDDEEMVARSIERTLRGHEFKITVANSGVQALQTARRKPPAIMLLDVNMHIYGRTLLYGKTFISKLIFFLKKILIYL